MCVHVYVFISNNTMPSCQRFSVRFLNIHDLGRVQGVDGIAHYIMYLLFVNQLGI
jgi:hypothetical protein